MDAAMEKSEKTYTDEDMAAGFRKIAVVINLIGIGLMVALYFLMTK